MSDFKAKMHQIRFQLTALPQAPYLYLRGLLVRGGRGKGEGKGREGPPISYWHRAPRRVNPALG